MGMGDSSDSKSSVSRSKAVPNSGQAALLANLHPCTFSPAALRPPSAGRRAGGKLGSLSTHGLVEQVTAHPGMHRDSGCRTGVDRPGRAKLGDVQDRHRRLTGLRREAGALLAEEQDAVPWQVIGLDRRRAGQIVNADDRYAGRPARARCGRGPVDKVLEAGVVVLMLVPVGDHGAPAIPPTLPDDVKCHRVEGICRTNHRTDVAVSYTHL